MKDQLQRQRALALHRMRARMQSGYRLPQGRHNESFQTKVGASGFDDGTGGVFR